MRQLALLLALACPVAAQAQEPPDFPRHALSVSGQAGLDVPSNQIWGGPELSIHPTQSRGFAGLLMVAPTYSLSDNTGLLWLEGGLTAVVPSTDSPSTTIRVGLWGRAGVPVVTYPLPVRIGQTGVPGVGLVPSGGGLVEFAWRLRPLVKDLGKPPQERRHSPAAVLGVRIGPGSEIGGCTPEDDLDECVLWSPGLTFQAYTRVDLRSGLHLEARVGTGFTLAIGKRFGGVPEGPPRVTDGR